MSCSDRRHKQALRILEDLVTGRLDTVWDYHGKILGWTVGVDLHLLLEAEQLLKQGPGGINAGRGQGRPVPDLIDPYA